MTGIRLGLSVGACVLCGETQRKQSVCHQEVSMLAEELPEYT